MNDDERKSLEDFINLLPDYLFKEYMKAIAKRNRLARAKEEFNIILKNCIEKKCLNEQMDN